MYKLSERSQRRLDEDLHEDVALALGGRPPKSPAKVTTTSAPSTSVPSDPPHAPIILRLRRKRPVEAEKEEEPDFEVLDAMPPHLEACFKVRRTSRTAGSSTLIPSKSQLGSPLDAPAELSRSLTPPIDVHFQTVETSSAPSSAGRALTRIASAAAAPHATDAPRSATSHELDRPTKVETGDAHPHQETTVSQALSTSETSAGQSSLSTSSIITAISHSPALFTTATAPPTGCDTVPRSADLHITAEQTSSKVLTRRPNSGHTAAFGLKT